MSKHFALVLHGGAYSQARNVEKQETFLEQLIADGAAALARGASGRDVVTDAVVAMEDSGLYVAGKGSFPNTDGIVECDAAIMRGRDQAAGAVAALRGIKNPIRAAGVVMEKTDHVMLAGQGAITVLERYSVDMVDDPEDYYRDPESEAAQAAGAANEPPHGTVGAVVLDQAGDLWAATSTGGTRNKLPGRVGDTPLIGSGTFADQNVAVSCTGYGEYFIRFQAAHDVAARVRYGGAMLKDAARSVIHGGLERAGGDGGLIAVNNDGAVALACNSAGMISGFATSSQGPVLYRKQVGDPSVLSVDE